MLPVIGMKGLFTFKPPFNTEEYQLELKVIAVRSFRDIEAEDIPVLTYIYERVGLSKSDYERDLKAEELVVIFSDNSNNIYRIPTYYITNTPIQDGVLFKSCYLGIPLGYIPAEFQLQDLCNEINDLVVKHLGVQSECKIIQTGREKMVEKTKLQEFQQRVSSNRTNRRYMPKDDRISELEKQVKDLTKVKENLTKFMVNKYGDLVIPEQRPNAEDLKTYTKYIKIEVKSKASKESILKDFFFYIFNSFNLNPEKVYLTRASRYTNDDTRYTCLLNGVYGTLRLTRGELNGTTPLPRMFSRSDYTKFVSNLTTIEIELDDVLNIRGYGFTPHDGVDLFTATYQITLYNKDRTVISVMKDNIQEDINLSVEQRNLELRESLLPEVPLT